MHCQEAGVIPANPLHHPVRILRMDVCRVPLPGENLKIMLMALSASMTACGVVGDGIPYWLGYYGPSLVQNIQDISILELYYNDIGFSNNTVIPMA